jgi:hypothetical protein
MAWVGAGLAVVGTILNVEQIREQRRNREEYERERRENTLWFGEQQRRRAEFQARLLEQAAGRAIAAGQREKLEVERVTKLTESRALALAAASGGGAGSPTVVNHIGNIAKRGAYLGAIALYNSEQKARDLNIAAAMARYEGELSAEAGRRGITDEFDRDPYDLATAGAIIGGAATLFNRYGRGGPSSGGAGGDDYG